MSGEKPRGEDDEGNEDDGAPIEEEIDLRGAGGA